MDRQHLDSLIASINGATFASIDTRTIPTIRGGQDNVYVGNVTKYVRSRSVMLFTNKKSNGYENMVRRRLEQQGLEPDSFVLGPRRWGIRIPDTPYVTHEGRMYLECILLGFGTEEYHWNADFASRKFSSPIPKAEIIGLKERSEAEQGGLSKKVELRVYSLDSIEAIRLMGEEVS